MRGRHGRWLRICVSVANTAAVSGTTSYTRHYWLIWHQVLEASRRLDTFKIWLSSAFFGQRQSLPSQTQSRLLRLSPALRRDHRVTEPRRPEPYLRGQLPAATALTEKGPTAADHPSKKGQVRFAMFDDPRNSTGHLGGDWAIRFAAQMFVVTVFGDIALERVSKAVGPLHNGDLACHP